MSEQDDAKPSSSSRRPSQAQRPSSWASRPPHIRTSSLQIPSAPTSPRIGMPSLPYAKTDASHSHFRSLPRRIFKTFRHRRATGDVGHDDADSIAGSMSGSMYGSISALPRRPRTYDDQNFQTELQSSSANGVRVWYESYTTIDWIHDAIKESSRLRRSRAVKGYRGLLINAWDRIQGWLIVTLVGIITAIIAGAIVKSEAILFDLKEGYCARNVLLAKRFCCPYSKQPDWDGDATSSTLWSYRAAMMSKAQDPTKGLLTGMGNVMLAGWAAPVATSPKWRSLADSQSESCLDWTTWADKLHLHGEWNFVGEYGIYILIAVVWASIAALLTIHLTASDLYEDADRHVKQDDNDHRQVPLPATGDHMDEDTPLLNGHSAQAPSRSSSGLPPKLLSQVAGQVRKDNALPARKVLYFGSGSGISEVKCILSGFVIHGYLGFWTLFTKSVGLALSVASGLSLGKEGPFVHIASCVGNIVSRRFAKYETNESKRREILSCACAAGVAVAFGAPVGGVLFSLEEVSYYFPAKVMFRSFFCAMVAAATLRFIDPFGTGKIVLFQVTYDRDWHWVELSFFVLIGLFGGVYGALFTKLNMFWSKNVRSRTWMAKYPLYEVIMITAVTVSLSFLNDYTRMGGPELIADLFSECHAHESLDGLCISRPSQIGSLLTAITWAMIVKGTLTIVTFGIKLPAGIFIPTLCVGACFGRIVGLLVQYAQWMHPEAQVFAWCQADKSSSCIVPGVYAMIGAAATLSGVTRTTISLVVIMFELTGTLTYSVPVMLSVLVARTVADWLEHKGIYDLVLEFSGLPYLDAKEEHTWQNVNILDATDTAIEVISLDEDNTVQSLRMKLERLALVAGNPDGGFPIVAATEKDESAPGIAATAKRRLIGYIAAQELEHGLNRVLAAAENEDHPDPQQIECTFDFLPRPKQFRKAQPPNLEERGTEDERGDGESIDGIAAADTVMRDSTLFAKVDSPRDLSIFVDRAPITLTTCSPLELAHQMFVKLGVRYVIVVRADDATALKGVIFKKRWLAFLHSLNDDEKHA